MAVNITIDQNQDTIINVANLLAASTDKILCQFYENKNNALNLATENIGGKAGDVVITAGVGYAFHVTEEYALKLATVDLSYDVFQLSDGDAAPASLQNGNVTNTILEGAEEVTTVNWYNGDRIRETTTTTSIKADDDTVIGKPANLATIDFNLLDANTIAGKEWEFKNDGQGDVDIVKPDDSTLITLNPGESVKVLAVGKTVNDYTTFYA